MMFRFSFFLIIACGILACQEPVIEGEIVAEAFERKLFRQDIASLSFTSGSSEDSARIVGDYIENWLREQVLMEYAENFLSEEQKDFTAELEDYRMSLLLYAYEEQILQQKLDTIVSDEEAETYYLENAGNFELKDYIVQVRFVILPDSTEDMDNFKKLFFSGLDDELVAIQEFCVNAGGRYFLDNEKWLYLDELMEQVPVQFFNAESFLKKNKNVSFVDTKARFFLQISDYKLKDDVSPLEMERENIVNLILNRRKIELLSQMRNDLYLEARNKNMVKKY